MLATWLIDTIKIVLTINGTTHVFEKEISLDELLQQLDLSDHPCAVEVNKTLVGHQERNECTIHDGDNIEIVTLVGGG